MSSYKDLTSKVSITTFETEMVELNQMLNTKIEEVDTAIANIPDVQAVAEENAIIMSIALG